MNPASALPWSSLSERERAVWGAVFAQRTGDAAAGVRAADAAVRELRALSLDAETGQDPEYEAARAGFQWEFEEFAPWYRVAWRLRHGHRRTYREPTLDDIRAAYDRFQQGRSDFY